MPLLVWGWPGVEVWLWLVLAETRSWKTKPLALDSVRAVDVPGFPSQAVRCEEGAYRVVDSARLFLASLGRHKADHQSAVSASLFALGPRQSPPRLDTTPP